jgi:hypothetical protein
MGVDHEAEKGHLPVAPESHLAVEKNDSRDLETQEHVDQDSGHSLHRHSEDTINTVPAEDLQDVSRHESQPASLRSRPLSIIPRSRRRGLLARFTIIPEVERPYEYKNSIKWTITAVVALAAAAAPIGSAIFYRRLSS